MEMVEQVHRGTSANSILLVGHFDHPYMCNDGLVGCLAGHEVLRRLGTRKTHFTYRMLSTIEIVGSVFYAKHLAAKHHIREGLFVATAGADAPLLYQMSSSENSQIDRILKHLGPYFSESVAFASFRQGGLGNDETAFDVHGVDIPCSSLQRDPFDQYHTDLDTPEHVSVANFESQVDLILKVIDVLEANQLLIPKFSGLPCLSRPEIDLYLPSPTIYSDNTAQNKSTAIFRASST